MTTRTKRWARRNPLIATFAFVVLFSMCVGYAGDIQSCRRTVNTRKSQTRNIGVLKRILTDDALRATEYARIDRSRAGARVNLAYAARRRALVAQFQAAPVPACFPFPGV